MEIRRKKILPFLYTNLVKEALLLGLCVDISKDGVIVYKFQKKKVKVPVHALKRRFVLLKPKVLFPKNLCVSKVILDFKRNTFEIEKCGF